MLRIGEDRDRVLPLQLAKQFFCLVPEVIEVGVKRQIARHGSSSEPGVRPQATEFARLPSYFETADNRASAVHPAVLRR